MADSRLLLLLLLQLLLPLWCAAAKVPSGSHCPQDELWRRYVTLPTTAEGTFHMAVFACNVTSARELAQDNDGTIYVGSRSAQSVFALRDIDGDGLADEMSTVATGLTNPHGVAVDKKSNTLFIATQQAILKVTDAADEDKRVVVTVVGSAFPAAPDTSAGSGLLPPVIPGNASPFYLLWHHIAVSPVNAATRYLFAAVGTGCAVNCDPNGFPYPNGTICDPCNLRNYDQHYASIVRWPLDMLLSSSSSSEPLSIANATVIAVGIRFSVGFDFHPQTGDMWFTENGHDASAATSSDPPDELNLLQSPSAATPPSPPADYQYPKCHGQSVCDGTYWAGQLGGCTASSSCGEGSKGMVLSLGDHVAALGCRFLPAPSAAVFPVADYGSADSYNFLLVAEHGSAAAPAGQISLVAVEFEADAKPRVDFITGFVDASGNPWARPTDVLFLPDGSFLFSDDFDSGPKGGGAVFRVWYTPAGEKDKSTGKGISGGQAAGIALGVILAALLFGFGGKRLYSYYQDYEPRRRNRYEMT